MPGRRRWRKALGENPEWMMAQHKSVFDAGIRKINKTPDTERTELTQCIQDMIEAYEGFYSYLALV